MQIKVIIFDFDDTLFQTRKVKFQAIKYWAKHFYGIDYTDADIMKDWGTPFSQMMTLLVQGKDDTQSAIENYFKILPQFKTMTYPGTVEAIQSLSKDFTLGVLSSTPRDLLFTDMALAEFSPEYFAFIQGEYETNCHKPDPNVFDPSLKFFGQAGFAKSEIVYIGDALIDFQAATAAGIDFVGITGHTLSREAWQETGAKLIDDLKELSGVLM